jgi:general secretion pathway protein G
MNRDGFSLIEVLVALVIVAIMSTVVALNLAGTADEARVTSTRSQLATLKTALIQYKSQQGFFPTEAQGLEALVREPETPPVPPRYPQGGYLGSREVPVDGWERPFLYIVPGRDNQPFEVISYGADGFEGGTGADADLGTSD